ncbi:S9 family peptidase [Sphingomonas sp. RT2P30]
MIRSLIMSAAILLIAQPARASSDAAVRFGTREAVDDISLSPDGKNIAFIGATPGRTSTLFVVSTADGQPKAVMSSSGDTDHLEWCRWSTNVRLVCAIDVIQTDSVGPLDITRLITVDADGKNLKSITPRNASRTNFGGEVIDWSGDGTGGSLLMLRRYVSDEATGNLTARTRDGVGVDRVDTTTLTHTTIEPPKASATEYISDGHGTVRMMVLRSNDGEGYIKGAKVYYYRKAGSREWLPFGPIADTAGFQPLGVDGQRNVVYGAADKDGRAALYTITLDDSLKRELVLARSDVDIDGLVMIGRQHRIVGASFANERRQIEFFDPELRRLTNSLSKALPGLPLVSFVGASADEGRLLLFAGSDVDPGHYYLFDKATHGLTEVLPARPQLTGTKLAAVKPVSFPAGDGTMIPAYLTLPTGSDGKNLPAIVLPHGGPDARDEWGFDWLAQFLANRGYAVLQPNYRGSAGYGTAFLRKNGYQSWRAAIGDINDGGRWLVKQGIADSTKLAILGWSYGGYAALQSNVLDPQLFKAIIAVAPVTDLETLRHEHETFTNYQLVDAQIGHGPHVREGSPAQNAGRIIAPVLLFHGSLDYTVGVDHSRMMASRLKGAGRQVELVEYAGLEHQLNDSNVRAEMLDKMDAFLRTSLKLPPAP